MKRSGWVLAVLVSWACVALAPSAADAQERGRPAAKRAAPKSNAPKKPKAKRPKPNKGAENNNNRAPVRHAGQDKPGDSPAVAAPESSSRPGSSAHAPSEDAARLAADADESIRKEGGEEVKTMEFGGLDIEGQLKTPQMLYFLNRLRAEFSRPELPHRSFIPELQRGTEENGF